MDNDRLDVFITPLGETCLSGGTGNPLSFDYANTYTASSAPNPVYTVPSSLLNDATNWTEIKFIYCSNPVGSEESHLIIGNYTGTSTTTVTPPTYVTPSCYLTSSSTDTNSPSYSYGPAYLYIDDISVKRITPTLSFSPNNRCQNTTVNFTMTPITCFSAPSSYYVWNFGDGSTPAVGNANASHSYSISGTYTVTVSYNFPSAIGCTPTRTTVVTVADCCYNPNTNNIIFQDVNLVPNGTSGATLWSSLTPGPSPGNTYTGNIAVPAPTGGSSIITNTLTIIGGFSVNAAVTFSNCHMSFNEAVAMKQYSTTIIDHSYLGGCNKLWAGIQTMASLTFTNSWIEDAYRAVDHGYSFTGINNHPQIIIDNVMFNKNVYGVALGTRTMTPGNLRIKGCLFSSRAFGTPNYTTTTRYNALYPNPAVKAPAKIKGSTIYGITANTIRSDIGVVTAGLTSTTTPNYFDIGAVDCSGSTNATLTNRFDYINEGIATASSRISVINNIFSNIINTGVGNTLGAIYHLGLFGGTETRVGALGGGCYPTSHYKNVFTSVRDGVGAVNGGQLDVQYNDFNGVSRYGVAVTSWSASSASSQTVVVSNNSFSTTSYAFYANDNRTITATVSSNTLVQSQPTYTSTGYGVYINEISKPTTINYYVHSNNFSGGQYSIYAVNSQSVRVVNNTIQIKKPLSTSIFNSGIELSNSDNCFVKGNVISCSPTNSGSWNTFGVFANASYNNTVKCNSITAVSSCMKFQGACYPTTIYSNSLNVNPSDPCLYGIWFDQAGHTGDIGYYNGSQWQMSDDVWGDFYYASGGADTKCQTSSNPTPAAPYKIYYDNTKTAALYTPSVNINTFNALSGDFSQSYSATVNGNTNSQGCGETSRINQTQSGGRSIDGENAGDLSNLSDKKRIIMKAPNINGKEIAGNENSFNAVDSLMTLYTQSKNGSIISSAKNINATIIPTNNIEQNQKDFNSVYCVYLEDDSLVTSNQIEDLKNIASLCPFTDGLAVYNARALMRTWDDSTRYYNVCENNVPDLTNDAARFAANSSNLVESTMPTVYPNPTNGSLVVNSGCKNCIFEVYDIIGKKVLSQKLNENETKVELNSLNNGTYLYKIVQDGVILKADKLLLNK
ncbi:MAG: T9SS type A sorting domain-containing protein [Sphingobacteriaceae bacterium]|nr:T9SS type A sorting domain-containing protein [Sphingobacteriaceae bacterium]